MSQAPDTTTAAFHPLDPGRVNMMDPDEVLHWCRELHCGVHELEGAVQRVGEHVSAVRAELDAHRSPPA